MAALPATPETLRQNLTYEEYLRMPETMQRCEVIEGELVMSPAPTDIHQWILARLNKGVDGFVSEREVGVVLFAPLDLVIRKRPRLTVRQPDLLYFSAERIGGISRHHLHAAFQAGVAPDLVVEILSPEERPRKLSGKLKDYAAIGIREVWLVHTEAETVEVLILQEGQYIRRGLYGQGDTIVSDVLPAFQLPVAFIFE